LPIPKRTSSIIGERVGDAAAIASIRYPDVSCRKPGARINRGDARIVPLLDLAGKNPCVDKKVDQFALPKGPFRADTKKRPFTC